MTDAADILIDDHEEIAAAPTLEKRVTAFVTDSAEQIVKAARENPTAAIAAGAAVVAGAIAAAAIPALRASKAKTARKPAARKPAAAKPAAKSTAKRTTARKAAS
jgi:hypothetical protein